MAHRLFVCVMLPMELAGRALSLGSEELLGRFGAAEQAAHRAVIADHLHLTLVFLGDRHKNEIATIHESIERAVSGQRACELEIGRLMTLPRRQTPRLLAGVTDEPPTLLEVHRRLVSRLIKPVLREKKMTPFLPHVTLLRYEPGTSPVMVDALLAAEKKLRFAMDEIQLVESIATQFGATYKVLRRFALDGG